ncbi:MAG: co-chaperone GroES [Bacteroidetes bacterium]|nr:co-chaperone GroES [Bacteroidota bacterium]
MNNPLDKISVVGDRVLIKPKKQSNVTKAGLYLPPGVKEKEQIQSGYIVKVGPGYPIPIPSEVEESWKPKKKEAEYIPLQCKEGDLAIFIQAGTHEIEYENEKYIIVSQHAILMLIRDDELID